MDHLFSYDGKKGDLINAGLELFAAKGYDGVSVREIAKAAGVSEAALYKHFAGKEDMALYIFTVIVAEYTHRLRKIKEQPITAVEKLCRIVDVTYRLYKSYPAEIRFALLSQYNWWDRVEEENKPHLVLKMIFLEGMSAGEIPKREVYFWIMVYSGVMLQPLAQYPYFQDVLPPLDQLNKMVSVMVRELFDRGGAS